MKTKRAVSDYTLLVFILLSCNESCMKLDQYREGDKSTDGGVSATAQAGSSAAGRGGASHSSSTSSTSEAGRGGSTSPAQSAVGGSASNSSSTPAGGSPAAGGMSSTTSTKVTYGGSTSTLPATGGTMSDTETPVAVHGKLKVVGTKLVDEHDVEVQLKGPSSGSLNWETTGYANDEATMTHLRNNWRASVIRAAMGVEPSGAYYDKPEEMEAKVKAVVDLAIKLGIYVIIDWHTSNVSEDPDHAKKAAAFFTKMATLYGDKPNVLYETYNEPLTVSWPDVLKPYHTAVLRAIRAIDPDNVVLLGTPHFSQRVDTAALDPVDGENLMYVLHFYSCTDKAAVRNYGQAALDAGKAIFVTEWGASFAGGGKMLCLDEADDWHDWMKTNKISWAASVLDNCGEAFCYFRSGTKLTESANEDKLWGHAFYVRDRMRE